jgi:ABC-type transporter Mla MlaB component
VLAWCSQWRGSSFLAPENIGEPLGVRSVVGLEKNNGTDTDFAGPTVAADRDRYRRVLKQDSDRVGSGWTLPDKEWVGVLKITRLSRKGRMPTIKLEGELLAPWVDAVRDACTRQGRRSKRLCLDLAAVTYVDAAGVQLLRDLLREGIEIAACSSFVAELLHLED